MADIKIENKMYLTPADQFNASLATKDANFDLADFLSRAGSYFNKTNACLTKNGRDAIARSLQCLKLNASDEVYITSTFDYPNISSCVTCTVFNFCKPSRVITGNTKAIFIIHEFGVPHPRTFELIAFGKEKNIPVIEDCAHTINSFFDNGKRVGSVGDWTIVSFPKIFPVHVGGLLLGNIDIEKNLPVIGNDILAQAEIVNGLWETIPDITAKRLEIFDLYKKTLADSEYEFIGFDSKNIMPWFFPVKVNDADKIITLLRNNNIECGLWHGTSIVVLPLHQYLTSEEIYYICSLLLKKSN